MANYLETFNIAAASLADEMRLLAPTGSKPERLSICSSLDYQNQVIADGATAYWPFCEGVDNNAEEIIAANNAVASDGRWVEADGPRHKPGSPWGESDGAFSRWFRAPNAAGQALDWDTPFAIECWYKVEEEGGGHIIFGKGANGGANGFRCTVNSAAGSHDFLFIGSPGRLLFFNNSWQPGRIQDWTHMVFNFVPDIISRNLTTCQLFINGVQVGTASQTGPLPADINTNDQFDMGGHEYSINDGWFGPWSDFAFYSGVNLTAPQVLDHYNKGRDSVVGTQGEATFTYTLDGKYPYGAQIRKVIVPGNLGRFQEIGNTETRSQYFISIDGGPQTEVRPNEEIPNLIAPSAGAQIELICRVNSGTEFGLATIDEQSNGDGPSLLLDSQITGVIPGTDGVRTVIKAGV